MPHRYTLVFRCMVINLVAFGLLGAAFVQGWLDGLFVPLTRIMAAIIFAVFAYGLVLCAGKIWVTSTELNDIQASAPKPGSRAEYYLKSISNGNPNSRAVLVDMVRLNLIHRIVIVRHIANSLVFLGLIGTVIGFIIALSGIDPEAATEVDNVAPMVSTLITGMSVALYTTLMGAVLNLWLIINHRILATGTVHLISAIIECGESDGRT